MENVDVADVEHADGQIERVVFAQQLQRFVRRADAFERGRVAQVQVDVFVVDLYVDASVLFEGEGVVTAADEQHSADAFLHQVAVVDRNDGGVGGGNLGGHGPVFLDTGKCI
ncbi:MAG: hypothetical protein ACLT1W_10035 [Alistipes onderdonkii]